MSAVTFRADLAGETWSIGVPDRWAHRLSIAFGHLATPSAGPADVHVAMRTAPTADEARWARAVVGRLPDPDGVAAIDGADRRLHVSHMAIDRFDLRTGRGESVLLDRQFEQAYLGTNLLLRHIVWQACRRSLVPVHAAAVGGSDGDFWLIPAAAGQGKSTLTASALAAGMRVLGDDFVLVDPETRFLYGLYGTIRLAPAAYRMVCRFFGSEALHVVARRTDEKLLLAATPSPGPGLFSRKGRLRGIFLLNRTGLVRLGGPVAPARTLQAFSSSLRLLPTLGYPAPQAFAAIGRLTRSVEARLLETGPDLVSLVRSLMDHTGAK